jgi:hypothetical protein
MRNGHLVALIGSVLVSVFCGAAVSVATSNPIGPPIALGPRALELEMQKNPEIAIMIERRGYPDWAERIEVDSFPPLDAYEIHLYYLRFDTEFAFTRASILGRPEIICGSSHPLSPRCARASKPGISRPILPAAPSCSARPKHCRARGAPGRRSTDPRPSHARRGASATTTYGRHVGRVKHHSVDAASSLGPGHLSGSRRRRFPAERAVLQARPPRPSHTS